ncbi:hypothetical protein C5748_23010 [Phyllobacterium phragmitis]|uniref:Uncharacterized protein n=1 Tax=Phyllobacterium phragmitis TaxID=2670329 RepID=A0A2S9IKS3_9HYPH|nr:hypothetical protein C5748_23010 [Phyllobacterium phragmitis]
MLARKRYLDVAIRGLCSRFGVVAQQQKRRFPVCINSEIINKPYDRPITQSEIQVSAMALISHHGLHRHIQRNARHGPDIE